MAMSSGKSSSMAVVLLLVAVVAGTCTSGAQAFFEIRNVCDKTVLLRTNTSKLEVPHYGDHIVEEPLKQFFTSPATFTLFGFRITPIRIPPTALDRLNQQPGLLSIEIRCVGFCITLVVVYNRPPNPRNLLQQYVLGPFCPGP